MNTEIKEQLHQLALKRSIPFCYSCYHEALTGTCKTCGSDDLMKIIKNDGPEYGTDWIVKSILETELTPIDLDEEFESMIREVYPEQTTVGFMKLDTATVMKDQDPTCWRIAQSEWEQQESDEGTIISFDGGSTYYRRDDVEQLIEKEV